MSDLRLVVVRRRLGNIAEMRFFQKLSQHCKIFFIMEDSPNFRTGFVDLLPIMPAKNQVASLSVIRSSLDFLSQSDIIDTLEVYSSLSFQMTREANSRKIPIIITVFETIRYHPFYYMPCWSLFSRYNSIKANEIHFVTKRARDNFPSIFPYGKSHQIYFGVDTFKFSPVKSKEKIFDFLFVGRLSRSKGIDILLQAFKRLSIKFPKAKLAIVGSGYMKEIVQAYTRNNSNIRYLGRIEYDRLPEVYHRSSILILPSTESSFLSIRSWEEQFGFVLIEAMASGLAIVASRSGAIPEIIGKDNMLIEPRNPIDLERRMIHFLTNNTLVDQVSRLNRQRSIDKFDADKQAYKLFKLINELV